MGKWDFNGLEIHEGEEPKQVMEELGVFEGEKLNLFRAYHTFRHEGKTFLHVGWNNGNNTAYSTLLEFAGTTDREFFSSYSELSELYYLEDGSLENIFYKDRDPEFEEIIWARDYDEAM